MTTFATPGHSAYYVTTPGVYAITVAGAQGGSESPQSGGDGAVLSGDYTFAGTAKLSIDVGGQGVAYGGGGGSFLSDAGGDSLLIAAGGGGGNDPGSNGLPAQTGTSGASAGYLGGAGGTNGSGGGGGTAGFADAGGGGGWLGDGGGVSENGTGGIGGSGGESNTYLAGGAGSTDATPQYPNGGYGGGGGGGAVDDGGGGGGYSGGGGGGGVGGGGGSYFDPGFTNTSATATHTGNGYVDITLIVTPTIATSAHPASVALGTSIADTATLTSANNPTGTVTFSLYSNDTASGTPIFTDTQTLTSGTATSANYMPAAPGIYYWVDTYNGDSDDYPVTSGDADEPVKVATLVYTGSIQTYTVTTTGKYALTAAGAQGGESSDAGGRGAVLSGDV